MTHITNTQLNEYLDNTLAAEQRPAVEAHLATCADCRAALAELAGLFAELATLPDVAFAGDVAPVVVSTLEAEAAATDWSSWVLAIQAAIGLGLLAWLWPSLQQLLQMASGLAETAVIPLQPQPRLLWQTILTQLTTASEQIQLGWQFDLPIEQWLILLISALVAWLVGNRLLFLEQG